MQTLRGGVFHPDAETSAVFLQHRRGELLIESAGDGEHRVPASRIERAVATVRATTADRAAVSMNGSRLAV